MLYIFYLHLNETQTRFDGVIGLKTLQVIGDICAKHSVFISYFIVFEIYGTQKLGFSIHVENVVYLNRPYDRYV